MIWSLYIYITHGRHTHLDDPGREDWEGFPSGTRAAAAGILSSTSSIKLPWL